MADHSSVAKLLVVVGETASGKSSLALELAERFNGEIICADSRTVYKGLDIGTAKPSPAEQARVPHHLLDIVTPDQAFTVADFKRSALAAINDISSRGKLPIMVGGTGLYVDSVLFDYEFAGSNAERDEQNPRHLKKSDEPKALHPMRDNTLILGLVVDSSELEARIRKRVGDMFDQGLEREVRGLSVQYGWAAPGLLTIGYQEFRPYLGGEQTIEKVQEQIARATRQYAKRQRTWFRRNKSIHWLEDPADAIKITQNFLSKVTLPA